jgi:hypothetical protein
MSVSVKQHMECLVYAEICSLGGLIHNSLCIREFKPFLIELMFTYLRHVIIIRSVCSNVVVSRHTIISARACFWKFHCALKKIIISCVIEFIANHIFSLKYIHNLHENTVYTESKVTNMILLLLYN